MVGLIGQRGGSTPAHKGAGAPLHPCPRTKEGGKEGGGAPKAASPPFLPLGMAGQGEGHASP
jgi:hypothetical protein